MADPDIVRKRQPFSRENEAFRILRLQRRFGLHARLRGDTTGCILKPGRKSFSPGIRLATSALKPNFPTEQNVSSKSSIISQPLLASTARIGRSPHSLKPTSNHTVRSFPEVLLPKSCGAPVTHGERRDECSQAQIPVTMKRSSCCCITCAALTRMKCFSSSMSGARYKSGSVEERHIETTTQRFRATKFLGAAYR